MIAVVTFEGLSRLDVADSSADGRRPITLRSTHKQVDLSAADARELARALNYAADCFDAAGNLGS